MNVELKPLTYEQVLELAHNHSKHSNPIWLEVRKKSNDDWDYSRWVQPTIEYNYSTSETGILVLLVFNDDVPEEFDKEDYDITWRCWTWYPDGMEAFYPWKEEKHD